MKARVVLCGVISSYPHRRASRPGQLRQPAVQIGLDAGLQRPGHGERFEDAYADLRRWEAEGLLVHRETVLDGLESCVEALNGLFTGANIGKMLVKVN